jgi:curved DNA-binding protein CbpA
MLARLVMFALGVVASADGPDQLVRTRREVEVNVKAMIYRILSRYPSKLAMYREVIQNSNDAGAKSMKLTLERDDCGGHPAPCFVVQDDGKGFDDESWERLITIASGNPDPNKVGGFGVGFYSVFSVTDTPIVQSNGLQLKFGWEGNELVAHKGPVTNTKFTSAPHTTALILPLGNITALVDQVNRNHFMVFLTKSLSFTSSLQEISLAGLPSMEAFTARKEVTTTIPPDANNISSSVSPNGIFNFEEGSVAISQVTFHTTVKKKGEELSTHAFAVLVKASARMLHYEKNTTLTRYIYSKTGKKTLPKQLPVAILQPIPSASSTSEDEAEAAREACISGTSSDLAPCAFLPPGNLFVGFATTQTTGSSFHLDARFYATMDRDSIEMGQGGKNDAHVGDNPLMTFNADLLFMGGRVAKLALDVLLKTSSGLPHEMSALTSTDTSDADDTDGADDMNQRLAATVRVLHGFAIDESTPNGQVAEHVRQGFFAGAVRMVLPCVQSMHTAQQRRLEHGAVGAQETPEQALQPWDMARDGTPSRTSRLLALCDASVSSPLLLPPMISSSSSTEDRHSFQFTSAPLLPTLLVSECPELLQMLRRNKLVVRPRIDHVVVRLPDVVRALDHRHLAFVDQTGASTMAAQYYISHFCDSAGYTTEHAVKTYLERERQGTSDPPKSWSPPPPSTPSRPDPFHCTEHFAAELLQWLVVMVRARQLVGCSVGSSHLQRMLRAMVVVDTADSSSNGTSLEHVSAIAPGTSAIVDAQFTLEQGEGLFHNVPLPPVALPQTIASRFTASELHKLASTARLETLNFESWWRLAAQNLSALARGHAFEGANASGSWHSIPPASALADGPRFGYILRLLQLLLKQEDKLRRDERAAKHGTTTSMLSVVRAAEIIPDRYGRLRRAIDLYLPKLDVVSALVRLPTVHPRILQPSHDESVKLSDVKLSEGFLKLLGVRSSLHIRGLVETQLAKGQGTISYVSSSQLLLLLLRSSSDLSTDEWEYLRQAPFMLPKTTADATSAAGVSPAKLYLPTTELEEAGFLVAHFQLPPSEDAKPEYSKMQQLALLRRLGVVETPKFFKLCQLAEKQQADGGASAFAALDFLASNMYQYSSYDPVVEPMTLNIIPAAKQIAGFDAGAAADEPKAYKPTKCYLEPNPLGLPVVIERYRQLAMLLGAQKQPVIEVVSEQALVLLCSKGKAAKTCTAAGDDSEMCAEEVQAPVNVAGAKARMMSANAAKEVLSYLYTRLSSTNHGDSKKGSWRQKWSAIPLVPLAAPMNLSLPLHAAAAADSQSADAIWQCEMAAQAFVATGKEVHKAFDAIIPAAAASADDVSGTGDEGNGREGSAVGRQCSHALVSAGALLDHGERVNGFLRQLGAYSLSFARAPEENKGGADADANMPGEDGSKTSGASDASGASNSTGSGTSTSTGAKTGDDTGREPGFFWHSLLLQQSHSSRLGQLLRAGVIGERAYCCMLGAAVLPAAHLSRGSSVSTGKATEIKVGFAQAMAAATTAKWFRRLRDSPVVLAVDTADKQGGTNQLVAVMGRSCYLQDSDDELLRLANPRYVCAVPSVTESTSSAKSGDSEDEESEAVSSAAITSVCRQSYEVLGARYLSDSIEFKHHQPVTQHESKLTASASTEFLEVLVQQRSSLVLFALRQKLLHSAASPAEKERVLAQVEQLFKQMKFRHPPAEELLKKELHFEGRLLRVDETDAIASSDKRHNATILLSATGGTAAEDEHSPSRLAAVSFEMAQLLSANTNWGVLTETSMKDGSAVLSLAAMRDCAQVIQFVLGSSMHTLKQLRYPIEAGGEVEYAIDARTLYLSKKKEYDDKAEEARRRIGEENQKKDFEERKAAFEEWEVGYEEELKTEAQEKAQKDAEEQGKKEAEEQERMVAETKARKEAQEKARKVEEERQRLLKEDEERSRKQAEEEARMQEEQREVEMQERQAREAEEEAGRREQEARMEEARRLLQHQEEEEEEARRADSEARRNEHAEEARQREQEADADRLFEEEQEESRRWEEEDTSPFANGEPPREVTLYTVLGLEAYASSSEIKKAYRRLAVKWHPDKHQGGKKEAEEKFKYITAAYSVLGSKRKRARYDNYGDDGGMPKKYTRAEDIFEDIFGGEDPYDPNSSWRTSATSGDDDGGPMPGSSEWADLLDEEHEYGGTVILEQQVDDQQANEEPAAESPTPAPTMRAPTPVTPTPTPIEESEVEEESKEGAKEQPKYEKPPEVVETDQAEASAEEPLPEETEEAGATPAPVSQGTATQGSTGGDKPDQSLRHFGVLEIARTIECESSLFGTDYSRATKQRRGQKQFVSLAEHIENAHPDQHAVYYLDCSNTDTEEELKACRGSPVVQALHALEPAVEVLLVTRFADLAVLRLIEGGSWKKSELVTLKSGHSFKLVQLTKEPHEQEHAKLLLGYADLQLADARCDVSTVSSTTSVHNWMRECARSAGAAMAITQPSHERNLRETKVRVQVLESGRVRSGLPVHVHVGSSEGQLEVHITMDEQAQLLQTLGQLKSSGNPRAQRMAKDMLELLCRYAYARAHAKADGTSGTGAGQMAGIFASISKTLGSA